MAQGIDFGLQSYNIEAPFLVDVLSSTEIYLGTSQNSSNTTMNIWKIKKIWQVGTVWNFGFPNGSQEFNYSWDSRYGYNYSS
jgi:hypothetical protein